MNKSMLIAFILSFSSLANAGYTSSHKLVDSQVELFSEVPLVNFKLNVYDSQTNFDGMVSESTSIVASYETENVSSLKDYGIVQFIKGCVFEDLEKNNGELLRRPITRKYFGKEDHLFVHKNWEIDSVDTDPVYASIKKLNSRLGGYFWIDEKSLNPIFDEMTKHYYLNSKPSYPELSVMDLPSGGMIDKNSSHFRSTSASLEFKICIYKMKDVPLVTDKSNTTFAKALKCFNWSNSHIYNKKTKLFDSLDEIHPFCKQTN